MPIATGDEANHRTAARQKFSDLQIKLPMDWGALRIAITRLGNNVESRIDNKSVAKYSPPIFRFSQKTVTSYPGRWLCYPSIEVIFR
jgi:hypothetical protein